MEKIEKYYFQHDSNARNDIKIQTLRYKYGFEGYGIYFAILEVMRSHEWVYTIDIKHLPGIALDFKTDVKKLVEIIDYMVDIELLKKNKKIIWSDELMRRMMIKDKKTLVNRSNAKNGGKKKASNIKARMVSER